MTRLQISELRAQADYYDCEIVTRHFIRDMHRQRRRDLDELRDLRAEVGRLRRAPWWKRWSVA